MGYHLNRLKVRRFTRTGSDCHRTHQTTGAEVKTTNIQAGFIEIRITHSAMTDGTGLIEFLT